MTHLPALALFNLLLISSATAVESPLSSGSPGMKDWPENAMAVPAMHTVARISFIMIKYLYEWRLGPEQEGGGKLKNVLCNVRHKRREEHGKHERRRGQGWRNVGSGMHRVHSHRHAMSWSKYIVFQCLYNFFTSRPNLTKLMKRCLETHHCAYPVVMWSVQAEKYSIVLHTRKHGHRLRAERGSARCYGMLDLSLFFK